MSNETLSMDERIGRWFGNPPREGVDALPVRVHGREFARTGAAPGSIKGFDQPLIWAIAGLLMWGLVMVYSASIALNDNAPTSHVWHAQYLARHALSVCIGFVVALLVFQVPMERWEKAAPWVFIVSIVLLIAVLLPFIGKSVNGARRWISFGFINFQPSELAKLGTLLYAANYMVRKMDVKEKFFAAVTPMGVAIAIVGSLLLAEPDMGAFLVIAVIAMGILFLGGVNARMFFFIATIVMGAFAAMVAASPWRRERIFAYLDPWSEEHAIGKGYQLSHSLIAFGRGEFSGVGLGGSIEKLHWLPEAHTDFLLAVIGEEFGLIGVLLVIALFLWMTRRIMHIGRQAVAMNCLFSGLVAQGVGIWIGFQAFINMGVNLGALPTKGLTLPLMSYGGSAIMMNLVALAVVLRIDHENRIIQTGGRV
jgi:cell division protein FtsW